MTVLVIDKMVLSAPDGGTKKTVHDDYLSFADAFSGYDGPPDSELIKQYFVDRGYVQEYALIIDINR